MALVHPDGDYSDADRARRRALTTGKQQADGMSKISGTLDPEPRATIDAVLAKWASLGMCHPDDDSPCVDGQPSQAAIQGDTRSPAQRNHDALKAIGRSDPASGQLGHHNGPPCTIIVSTTLHELESGCEQAVTATGTLLPIPTVIRMASHAYHYLTIFDKDTGRARCIWGAPGGRIGARACRRIASPDQRIVLSARDCTRPGCSVAAANCQVHHAVNDWADDGQTNVDDLTLACSQDNRNVTRRLDHPETYRQRCLRDVRPRQGRIARLLGRPPGVTRRARGLARSSGAALFAADLRLSAVVGASTRRVRGHPRDRTVLRHKPQRRSGQGVWGTPQRWRKSTEGCRMA